MPTERCRGQDEAGQRIDVPAGYPDASRYIDGAIDEALSRDPFELLARLREKHGPIVEQQADGRFYTIDFPDNFMFNALDRSIYLALSFESARKVMSDNKSFSNTLAYGPTLGRTFGETLMTMDGPRHSNMKKLVLPSFGHRSVDGDLARVAGPIIDQALDAIVDGGAGELVAQFTAVFPYLIIARMFGIPDRLSKDAEDLVVAASMMSEDPHRAVAALLGMDGLYQQVVDDHRVDPRDDLVTALINTEVDGVRLTDTEVVSFIKQIVAAGLDTTARQTANLIYLLLENPDQFALLAANPALLENAIFEGMRFQPAGGFTPRVATCDIEVEGVAIPEGAGVYAVIHSGNRDPARWDNPDKFDIMRPRKQFLTLGVGAHACLGANLTIAEQKLAMSAVLSRLKNLRKDPARWDDAHIRGFQLRSATKLPVLWET